MYLYGLMPLRSEILMLQQTDNNPTQQIRCNEFSSPFVPKRMENAAVRSYKI